MLKLCFYVPETHLDVVKTAIFATGAGRIGNYDSCCWQTAGQGQFRPLAGAQPFLGVQGSVEYVNEYKVELVCEEALLEAAVMALKASHPYEEPAFDVMPLIQI